MVNETPVKVVDLFEGARLTPTQRRIGVATALVNAGVLAVRHLGARSVMLEVRYDNEPAIALYQRLGFEQLAAREHYYGPGQHALILKLWDLPSWQPVPS